MISLSKSDLLPPDFELRRASFYSACGLVSNIRAGVKDGNDCVVFDFNSNTGETSHTDTVVGVRLPSPKEPTTWLSRSSGMQLERVGEWILGFQQGCWVGRDKCDTLVSDVLKLLQYAREFPQNA